MEIEVIRTKNNSLYPLSEDDQEDLKKIKIGEPYRCKIWKPRNYLFHQKFICLIKAIYHTQRHFDNMTSLRYWLTMKAGFFKAVVAPNGNVMYFAESIKFNKMDDVKFEKLYNKVLDIALQEDKICKGSTKEELENYMNEIMSFI